MNSTPRSATQVLNTGKTIASEVMDPINGEAHLDIMEFEMHKKEKSIASQKTDRRLSVRSAELNVHICVYEENKLILGMDYTC
jgi:hypothetical protein